jgi:hypothetical protein
MWVKCKRNNIQGTLEYGDARKKEIVNKTITTQPLVNASKQALRGNSDDWLQNREKCSLCYCLSWLDQILRSMELVWILKLLIGPTYKWKFLSEKCFMASFPIEKEWSKQLQCCTSRFSRSRSFSLRATPKTNIFERKVKFIRPSNFSKLTLSKYMIRILFICIIRAYRVQFKVNRKFRLTDLLKIKYI